LTVCGDVCKEASLHCVSRLIFVQLPAGDKGDEPKASSKHWRANCTRGEPKNPNKSADFPRPQLVRCFIILSGRTL